MTDPNIPIILGRLDGIHIILLTLARNLPPDIADRCLRQLRDSSLKIDADLNASPVPDTMILEMQRVIDAGAGVLQHAALSNR